ncbi:MAG: transketolase [Opitutales bacterium]|nr:transketolase [Opitutales bacterium]
MKTIDLLSLQRAANEARGLAIDAISGAKSGHMGLPLGAAEIGAALFGACLNFSPSDSHWINRDRFVLSAGHGSMFLYAWLHLANAGLTLDDVKAFRKRGSVTPGHPEFGCPCVEATTGPLGQGIGNLVGMALAAKKAAAVFNTSAHKIFDQRIVGLCGDGCLQEGISYEAAAFAGRFALDNLILFYDSNDITLDAPCSKTQAEDVQLRFKAAGWDVCQLDDGHDIEALVKAYENAKAATNGRPKLIVCKTLIGKGVPEVEGTTKAHGEGGGKFADSARKAMGLPEEKFYVSPETRAYFDKVTAEREAAYAAWRETYAAWRQANPQLAGTLDRGIAGDHGSAEDNMAAIPPYGANNNATRVSGEIALNVLAEKDPLLLAGSADLFSSVKTYIKNGGDYDVATPEGRNIFYGIREHAMVAISNGIAYFGIFKPMASTFLTFVGYALGSVRVSALAKLPVFFVLTHDSVAVGEDGPTHQPVELVSTLRCIPNLDVFRPGDSEETAAAYAYAASRKDGPVALCLSRQNLPALEMLPVETRRAGTLMGAYVAVKETAPLERIIIASGSELQYAVAAAADLGAGTRVVSMPSMQLFDRQPADYKESVLPSACRNRVAIEAGITAMWWKYVGLDGKVLGTDSFGFSAPGAVVLDAFGMNKEALAAACR